MKFSVFAPLALVLAGAADAAHIPNFKAPRAPHRRGGASATYAPSSTSSAQTPSPSGGTSGNSTNGAAFANGIKRGLSFNDATLTKNFDSNQISWVYNWASTSSGTIPAGIQFTPMLWTNSDSTTSWDQDANTAIANGTEYLLFYNEADYVQQSNIAPADAAASWLQQAEPFAGKAKLVSPSVTNGAAPMGTAWLDEFIDACSTCTIDAIAIHIYDSATNIAYYKSYISDVISKYNKPVWLTEFGATGTDAEVQTFLQEMVAWLDAEPGVAAYAWFMDTVGNLVNADASLTALGETYVAN